MTNQNTVLIIGSGRSGRGMLGELYHKAGFHIVFADNDPSLVNGLRAVGHYSVEMTDLKSGAKEESVITDFAVLNTVADRAAYIEQLATSRWISTALMPAAFDRVMEDVAEAALLRLSRGTSEPQFITLGANFVGMETYCTQKLRTLLGEDRWNAFSQNTHLIMSIVNRKNLLPRCPDTQDPYRVEGDNKPVLRVEDLPALRNAADRPPFFRLESGLDRAMAIKIWSGNLVQCSMAFIAIQKGITGTYEASWDPDASRCAVYAAREGYRAVAAEYGLPPRSAEEEKAPVCVFRGKDFNDSLARLIRDPIRKLGRQERFIGPALCCVRHGIVPYYITKSCAHVFLYNCKDDPQSVTIQRYLHENGIDAAVSHFCQLDPSQHDDSIVQQMIAAAYLDITHASPLEETGP